MQAARAAREGAAPRASWAGAPLAQDEGKLWLLPQGGTRHLCATESHIQRNAHSNCRAGNQQVPQRPPIAGWDACLSGVGARLDQAAKLAASPHGQELKKARTVSTQTYRPLHNAQKPPSPTRDSQWIDALNSKHVVTMRCSRFQVQIRERMALSVLKSSNVPCCFRLPPTCYLDLHLHGTLVILIHWPNGARSRLLLCC